MAKSDLDLVSGEYAPVAARITLFYERFADGRIVTELVSRTEREVTFKASVYRSAADREPAATGWASELEGDGDINTVACLENTETSAIGRALANLGFTASKHRPSAEEILKASRARARSRAPEATPGEDALPARSPVRLVPRSRTRPDSDLDPAVLDVLAVLGEAERAGMTAARAARLRKRVAAQGVGRRGIERIERALRRWLAARGPHV